MITMGFLSWMADKYYKLLTINRANHQNHDFGKKSLNIFYHAFYPVIPPILNVCMFRIYIHGYDGYDGYLYKQSMGYGSPWGKK
jgi:hypothetical protein